MNKITFLISALIILVGIDFSIPKYFPLINENNYLLGFEKFRNIAKETMGEDRIILVGGSSLGWGVSANELTKSLNVLTLNSGVHAGIGYRNFFRNLSDITDKKYDIFVISPEYSGSVKNLSHFSFGRLFSVD